MEALTLYLRRGLDSSHVDLLDDIVADLHNCAFNRAVNGARPGFFEALFAAYRAGGFPCGWLGNYPVGALAIYIPRANTIELS